VKENVVLSGEVIEVMRDAKFRIKLHNNSTILAHLGGKLRKHNIKILLGDLVDVELSVYDLTKGRIIRRS